MLNKVLEFWFKGVESERDLSFDHIAVKRWNDKSSDIDDMITHKFAEHYVATVKLNGKPDDLMEYLATIITLDQLPRHIFRGSPKMYDTDQIAIELTKEAIYKFDHRNNLNLVERMFLYMPLMHSEELLDEQLMIKLFAELKDDANLEFFDMTYKFAARHLEIIQRFDRFPHRNKILKRKSTAAEIVFLDEPMSSF